VEDVLEELPAVVDPLGLDVEGTDVLLLLVLIFEGKPDVMLRLVAEFRNADLGASFEVILAYFVLVPDF